MSENLEALTRMQYPGRIIIIGASNNGAAAVMYAVTGRSPSSQARKLVIDNAQNKINVTPTDEKTLKTGNPDLLVYPAVIVAGGIAVSNGKQTSDIPPRFQSGTSPAAVLDAALGSWEYEPDEPNYTPRISGCVFGGAALSIIKRAPDGSVERKCFDVPMVPGKGKLIATYTGVNVNPLPSFAGDPLDVSIPYATAQDAAEACYQALAPATGGDDYRVAAAAVYQDQNGKISMAVKNRHD
jgi:IMP cyclohydrolase